MRRFYASDERAKKLRSDLANIGKKIEAHVVSIKRLELEMSELSTIVNPRQPGILPSNTVKNLKNDGHCMAITI